MVPEIDERSGDVVLRDPGALRALAHADRFAILERLRSGGPATATQVGAAVGISPSAASYHLRALARFGLVEDAGGGSGRNRPWRAIGSGFRFDPSDHAEPSAAAAAQLLGGQLLAQGEAETIAFVRAEAGFDPAWRAASMLANKTLALTAEEAAGLVRRLEDLVEPYVRSRRPDAPDDARDVRLLLRLFPRTESESEPAP